MHHTYGREIWNEEDEFGEITMRDRRTTRLGKFYCTKEREIFKELSEGLNRGDYEIVTTPSYKYK